MSADFTKAKLSDVCVEKVGVQTGPFGSQLHNEDYVDIGTPIITVEHLGDNRILHQDIPLVSDRDKDRLSNYHLEEGDIVFSRVGSVDRRSLVRKEEDGWLFSGRCLRVRVNRKRIDPVFLSYFFGLEGFRKYIRSIAVGATMPSINTKILSEVPIYFPELKVQRTIGRVLYEIDEKIDLNRQINQTLEQIAQAIFKSWFVDFEPVRAKIQAKEEGRDPQRAAMCAISDKSEEELDQLSPEQYDQLVATAALFPDELVNSELGEIPKGWEVGDLSAVCILNELSWTNKTLPQDVWYVDLANTKDGVINEVQRFRKDEIPSRARRILKPGDTIIGTVRPGNRSFALIGNFGIQITGSTGFAVLTPKIPELREFVYISSTSESNIERLAHLADGGAYPAVRPEVIIRQFLVFPPISVMRAFHSTVGPMYDRLLLHIENDRRLAKTRDTLLPKLLSGELTVKAKPDESDLSSPADRSDKSFLKEHRR